MNYSRTNPSARYRELQAMYRELHEQGEIRLGAPPEATFSGKSLMPQVHRIRKLIDRAGARNVLDYGSGKGRQYDAMRFEGPDGTTYDGVIDYWGVDYVHCYDPGYERYSKLPEGHFDAVVSTDVLEHCPEEDVPWVLQEMFNYAERCVYANIACYPARKHLPNGENAHCTIKPIDWWHERILAAAAQRPGLVWEVWLQSLSQTPDGPVMQERCLTQE